MFYEQKMTCLAVLNFGDFRESRKRPKRGQKRPGRGPEEARKRRKRPVEARKRPEEAWKRPEEAPKKPGIQNLANNCSKRMFYGQKMTCLGILNFGEKGESKKRP